ncbi:hypothetical protein SAMN04487977_10353 [Treponema bryantii]|uniref:Uncharacterized protein n=1 Tax=Treponema bryantii TaxID=163 RepID=A0A1H9E7N9_9SPIR|nr:hypothetical protein [Treponema bryantii]SEQ21689.1 hypothetical protein SAMN04487977_10353 [Treponema bryantii]
MNQIQQEIAKALIQLSEKNLITEATVAKKIRENLKFHGKQKAGLCFQDIEEAAFNIEETNNLHYSVHLNSANDLLLKQSEKAEGLNADARKRRLASEKSMSVLTNGDVKSALSGKAEGSKPYKKRTEKKHMNVNKNYDDWE